MRTARLIFSDRVRTARKSCRELDTNVCRLWFGLCQQAAEVQVAGGDVVIWANLVPPAMYRRTASPWPAVVRPPAGNRRLPHIEEDSRFEMAHPTRRVPALSTSQDSKSVQPSMACISTCSLGVVVDSDVWVVPGTPPPVPLGRDHRPPGLLRWQREPPVPAPSCDRCLWRPGQEQTLAWDRKSGPKSSVSSASAKMRKEHIELALRRPEC